MRGGIPRNLYDRSRKQGTVALPSFPKEMSQAVLCSHTWPGKEMALSGDQHTGLYIRGTLSLSGHGRIWGLAKTREGEPRGCVNTSRIRVVDGGLGGDSPWLNARGKLTHMPSCPGTHWLGYRSGDRIPVSICTKYTFNTCQSGS